MEVTTLSVPSLTSNVSETLYQFQQQRYLCDVLIFTSDGYIPAHRVVLVAASKHFQEIESSRNIHTTPEANFYLTKEKSEDMQKIVQLIYTGLLSISAENMKRIHSLCKTLGLEGAIELCEQFIIETNSKTGQKNNDSEPENEESHLSLKQLETEVINHLEKSRSNNNTYANFATDPNMVDAEEKCVFASATDNVQPVEEAIKSKRNCDKKTKAKGQRNKNKKVEEDSNQNGIQSPIANEKLINCALCKDKFLDKKQLMEHRRIRHSNKRKPMHTKRYIPNSEGNEVISDVEDQENTLDNSFSSKNESEQYEDEESVLSTRQGTKRRSLENFTKLKKTTRFVCRLCKDVFASNDLLQEHRKLIHPGGKRENLTCQLCDKVLSTWLNLIEHKFKKHGIGYDVEKYKVLMCDMPNCDFSTIVEYKMKTHYSDVHGEVGSYICELCNKGCKSAPQLKYHMKTVHPDNKTQMLYRCDECGKTFRHSCNLKKHVDYVHLKISDKKYLCHLCTYKCMSKTDLNNHLLKIHDIPLPKSCKVYKCDKCDYFTLTRSCYDRHVQLHQEDGLQKTYICSTCGKGFYNIQNVKAHEKRHKSEVMFCPFEGCGYSTKFKHTMKNHIAGMHTHKNLKPYQCHLCEYSCKLKGNLDKHLRGKHGVEVMTIPKLRKKAIETGKGFSDIVFPPRNCSELPAKIADKHHLQTTQKSQDFQDISFPQLLEMAKQASKEARNQSKDSDKSPDGDLIHTQLSDHQTIQKDSELEFQSQQNPAVMTEVQTYHEPMTPTPISMDADGPSYNQDQVALSNLNPVPISVPAVKQSSAKDSSFISSNDIPGSYGEQSLLYLNENAENSYSTRPLPAHIPQSHSAESYAAILSSFLNSKNASQISPHQTLPSLLPLNMQNFQSTGQHHPMILNHLLTQMEEAGYSALSRPTSVPTDDSASYQPQLRSHSVDNLSYRNSPYQSHSHFDHTLSPSDELVRYRLDARYQSSTNHREAYNKETPYSPEMIIHGGQSRSNNRQQSAGDNSVSKSSDTQSENQEEEEDDYQDIAELAYNQS